MILLFLAIGCADDYTVCDDVPAERLGALPDRLSETGLYADIATDTLTEGVEPYAPRFELWSDGADKRRWIALPEGGTIDTSDLDAWAFPEGTKLWKEFSRDGVRVETRLLQKVGPAASDWAPVAYVWEGEDATAAPEGAQNASGTAHDVPAARDCAGCHGGTASFVLGFSAIQLPESDLQALIDAGTLSDPPASIPVLPGNEADQAALGYLHANCSHCHNQARPEVGGSRCFDPGNDLDFSLRVGLLGSVAETPAYTSALGNGIEAGSPDESAVLTSVEAGFMPPLGREEVDPDAVAALSAWIAQL